MQETKTTDEAVTEATAPTPITSRAQRRATMRQRDNRLMADRKKLLEIIRTLEKSNRNMNTMLVWIASVTGVAQPQDTMEQRQARNDGDRLQARIVELVQIEKRVNDVPAEAGGAAL